MRLSMRAEYGVRAMVVLALKFNRGLIPLKEIARKERISYQYLEQIFPLLKKAELVDSVRGRHGGYRLAREPADVSVGDIINAVEGPIAPTRCVARGHDHGQSNCCKFPEDCVTRKVWTKLRDHIVDFVDNISLEDMVNWSRERAETKGQKEVKTAGR
ncbi:MAG: Rrf2 family transcriptional regulator [Dethiobacteria bacterium]